MKNVSQISADAVSEDPIRAKQGRLEGTYTYTFDD